MISYMEKYIRKGSWKILEIGDRGFTVIIGKSGKASLEGDI